MSLFFNSIQAILKSWTALQLAVSHSFGGPHSREKAQWLVGVVEDFFKQNDNLEVFELEDFLIEIMSTEFNLTTEDDSVKEISRDICCMYKLWKDGNHDDMRKRLSTLPCVNLGECVSADANNTEEGEDLKEQDQILSELSFCSPSSHTNSDEQRSNETTQQTNSAESSKNDLNNDSDDGWVHVVTRKRRQKK